MEDPSTWDRLTAALYHSAGPDEEVWRFLHHVRLVRGSDSAKFSKFVARLDAREAVAGPSAALEVATALRVARLATADGLLPDPHGAWAREAWRHWRRRALRRRTLARWLHPFRRPTRFTVALGQPGFSPRDVRVEFEGRVEHGPVRGDARHTGDGVVALLAQGHLGWAMRSDTACAGWFKGDWVSAWSIVGDMLHVEYWLPPHAEASSGPFDMEPARRGAQYLQVTAHPTDLDELVARARRVLPQRAAGVPPAPRRAER